MISDSADLVLTCWPTWFQPRLDSSAISPCSKTALPSQFRLACISTIGTTGSLQPVVTKVSSKQNFTSCSSSHHPYLTTFCQQVFCVSVTLWRPKTGCGHDRSWAGPPGPPCHDANQREPLHWRIWPGAPADEHPDTPSWHGGFATVQEPSDGVSSCSAPPPDASQPQLQRNHAHSTKSQYSRDPQHPRPPSSSTNL